jgi:hypothetical protein
MGVTADGAAEAVAFMLGGFDSADNEPGRQSSSQHVLRFFVRDSIVDLFECTSRETPAICNVSVAKSSADSFFRRAKNKAAVPWRGAEK